MIYNQYLYRGGEDTYIEELINLLENKGHKVIFYSKDSKNIQTLTDKIKTAVGLFFNNKIATELSEIIKKEKPDVAHFHNIYPLIGATAYRICKKFNIPIIQHIHNYRFLCPKANLYRDGKICEICPKNKTLLPAVFFGCYHDSRLATLFFVIAFLFHKLIGSYLFINKYIFPSLFTQKYYQTSLKLKKKHIVYLPYFVEEIPQNIKRPKYAPKKYYLYLGRLVQEKGILRLLQFFKNTNRKLIVLGDGPLKTKIYEEYKKNTNIILIPHSNKKKVFSYLKYCEALLIPSEWYEVLPLVYLEAVQLNKKIFLTKNNNLMVNKFSKKSIYIKPEEYTKYFTKNNIRTVQDISVKNKYVLNNKFHYTMLMKIYDHLK